MADKKNIHNVYVGLGSSNHTEHIRSKNDFYATPPYVIYNLLDNLDLNDDNEYLTYVYTLVKQFEDIVCDLVR